MKPSMLAVVLFATSLQAAAPLVDHHQHLVSPETAAVFNGPLPLPAIALPDDLARLMRLRTERWDDPKALAELYTANAVVLRDQGQNFGWVQGRERAAGTAGTTYARPFTITPAAFGVQGSTGYIAANLTRGEGTPARRHFGVIHFGLEKGSDGVWRIASENFATASRTQQAYGADELVRELDAAGIGRAVVLSVAAIHEGSITFTGTTEGTPEQRMVKIRADNDWTAREVAKHPNRLIGFCAVDLLAEHTLTELPRCKSNGFRGVKLHLEEGGVDFQNPEHVAKVARGFAEINRHGLAIVVHPGNNQRNGRANAQILFDRIISQAPDVTVQIAHLWGGNEFSPEANETLAAYAEIMRTKRPKNVWFDMAESAMIAATMGEHQAEVLRIIATRIREIGPDRILFGTDGPALLGHMRPKEAWEQFRALVPLTAEEMETIAKNVAPYLK